MFCSVICCGCYLLLTFVQPLVDIDVEGEEPAVAAAETGGEESTTTSAVAPEQKIADSGSVAPTSAPTQNSGKHKSLATPAVRRVSKELNVDITQVTGTGKDGRVMKEDVLAFHKAQTAAPAAPAAPTGAPTRRATATAEETVTPLTPVQTQMFKAMSNSLSIPHFLYTDEVRLDTLTTLRARFNKLALANGGSKMSYMPFFIKAMSVAISEYPIVNSRVVFEGDKPALVTRPQHNIGIAMDTPAGLIVPNIKNVQDLSIAEIAAELSRLQAAAATGKFAAADLKGGTISISNIGTVGGTYLSPVIVESEVAILAVGRARTVPLYKQDGSLEVVPTQVFNTSWSGDHRVLDGVTLAKTAERFKNLVEDPELLLLSLR